MQGLWGVRAMCGPAWRPSTVGALRRCCRPLYHQPPCQVGSLWDLWLRRPHPGAGGTACLRGLTFAGACGVTRDRPGVTRELPTRDRPGSHM